MELLPKFDISEIILLPIAALMAHVPITAINVATKK